MSDTLTQDHEASDRTVDIEVTPEMIKVGEEVFVSFDPRFYERGEALAAAYRAMFKMSAKIRISVDDHEAHDRLIADGIQALMDRASSPHRVNQKI